MREQLTSSVAGELRELFELHCAGALSADEFRDAKRLVLGRRRRGIPAVRDVEGLPTATLATPPPQSPWPRQVDATPPSNPLNQPPLSLPPAPADSIGVESCVALAQQAVDHVLHAFPAPSQFSSHPRHRPPSEVAVPVKVTPALISPPVDAVVVEVPPPPPPVCFESGDTEGELQWDRSLSRGVHVSNDGLEATCTRSGSGGHVVVGTQPFDPTDTKSSSWSVVLLLRAKGSKDVLVGVTGRAPHGNCAFVLRGDGCIVSEVADGAHIGQYYASPLGSESNIISTVTVTCCITDLRLSFRVDGKDMGVAFELPENLTFYPMVVLCEEGEAALLPRG